MDCGSKLAESLSQLSTENASIRDYSSSVRCSGLIGVPITFLDRYNPEQFEIIGLDRYTAPKETLTAGRFTIKGKSIYARILIKRRRKT